MGEEGEHGERASGRIKLDELEKRRLDRPPCQPVVPKGSLVVRVAVFPFLNIYPRVTVCS
jgi:hypothetical protein